MLPIKQQKGQSNYDLCMQAYGSLNLLVKFCRDNNISDIDIAESKVYYYDPSLVEDKNVSGYTYITGGK